MLSKINGEFSGKPILSYKNSTVKKCRSAREDIMDSYGIAGGYRTPSSYVVSPVRFNQSTKLVPLEMQKFGSIILPLRIMLVIIVGCAIP